MSFKDGIPLLTTLDDDSDEDFTVELATSRSQSRFGRKHLLFSLVLGLVVFFAAAVIVAVTVPVVLLQGGGSGDTSGTVGTNSSLNDYKPSSDYRQYKFITLSNSLRVVLISDPKSNLSSASMEVAAGSFSDPPYAEGLAHFCEHMLFLGTEKYPNDHEYSNYLTSHGGLDNAFTSTQETNYYFGVDSKYLEGSLDRLAQFFIAPLFRNTSVADEVHAVNAEHEKNLQSDPWKLWQLLKHVSNPLHPFHQFSTGSLSTLNDTNLLELLELYYNTNYSANTMQLVVYGKDSIPTLTNWVRTYFSDIPNRKISPQTFTNTAFPPPLYTGHLVLYYPVADSNSLSLYWQTTPLESHYRNDIVEFLSRYLGYEGPGSVLEYLRSESWATSLSAGLEIDADSFSLLVVNVDLTEEGLGRVADVVRTVFQFIRLLSSQSESQLMELWDNHVAVSQVVFDHSEPDHPNVYTTVISQKMRVVKEASDFLGNPRRFIFNQTFVRSVLNSLTPEKLVAFIRTRHVNISSKLNVQDVSPEGPPEQGSSVELPWPELDTLEPIYSTPYSKLALPQSLIAYWNNLVVDPESLFLPETNGFIPSDFDILEPPASPSDTPVRVNLTSASGGASLWWLQDTTFSTPHVNMYCTIDAAQPTDRTSVRWSEMTTLYTLMATVILSPVLYPAKELTYSTDLLPTPGGLHLTFSGFSDPEVMRRYINTTVTYMKEYSRMREVFGLVREQRQDYLQNYKYTTLPYSYIYRYLQQVVMERPFWKHEEELEIVNDVALSVDDIIDHAETLFSGASFLCFVHGNVNQTTAQEYTELVVGGLSPSPSSTPPPRSGYQRERVSLAQPGRYSVTLPTLNPRDQNSAVNVVFQVGPACTRSDTTTSCSEDSINTSAHLGLLDHIIGDECFYQLRTVEQLGYVVFCFHATYSSITSFQTLVQSQEYNATYVLGEIDLFLENFEISTVANFTEGTLRDKKEEYARTLRKKSQTLTDESDRLWSEIATGREQFDYSSQLLGGLDSITPQSLHQFYRRYITDPSSYRKLMVGVYGADNPVDFVEESDYCIDWDTLDHTAFEYPTDSTNCS